MNTKPPANIIQAIKDNDVFLAHAHLGPDSDSVGSVIALKLGLEQLGKTVHLFCEDELPSYVQFLDGVSQVENTSLFDALDIPYDIYLSLDTAAWKLATHHNKPIPKIHRPVINIDHHPDNNIKTTLSWVDKDASAVCEMIYYILISLDVKIDTSIATSLLLGILHDTDKFQNKNTFASTLELASNLIKLGGKYQECITNLARSYTTSQLKLFSYVLSKLKLSKNKKFIYASIGCQEVDTLGITEFGSFANAFLGRFDNTEFGCLLVEKKPGIVKGYLRSRTDFDVSLVAHQLFGGGHKAASGFRLEKNILEAESAFLSAVDKVFKLK